jgi:hypothetical protein
MSEIIQHIDDEDMWETEDEDEDEDETVRIFIVFLSTYIKTRVIPMSLRSTN